MTARRRWEIAAALGAGVLLLSAVLQGAHWVGRVRREQHRREVLTAISEMNPRELARLVREVEDHAVIGRNGITALMVAAQAGDLPLARRALDAGVEVNAGTVSGRQTALMHAAAGGNAPMVQLLVASGADVNARDHAGETALMFAAANGDTATVRCLLQAGADVNAKDRRGQSALSRARSRKWAADAARLLKQVHGK